VLPHLDDDLALGTSFFDEIHSRLGGFERERPLDDWADDASIDERGDFAQLIAVSPHEQEREPHVESLGLSPCTEAQYTDDRLYVPGHTDFVREGWVGWSGYGDERPAGLQHPQGLVEGL